MTEVVTGGLLVFGAALGALIVAARPRANAFDRWWFTALPPDLRSDNWLRVTDLGSPVVLVVVTLGAALVAWRRDRLRSLACLIGPPLVAGVVELVIKPAVGRRFEGVLSYPSGNVADVAAVATAWVVAVSGRLLRALVAVVAMVAVAAMFAAVVALRWHYPSDALGGALLGVGAVLALDGALHLLAPGAAIGSR